MNPEVTSGVPSIARQGMPRSEADCTVKRLDSAAKENKLCRPAEMQLQQQESAREDMLEVEAVLLSSRTRSA